MVFTDRTAERKAWFVPPCSSPEDAYQWTVTPRLGNPRLSIWWYAPGREQWRRFHVPPEQFDELQALLDRPETKKLTDFLNAGPGVGDYEIEIDRSSGTQKVLALSLMPTHYGLKHDPTLPRVICEAKKIAGLQRPAWCPE